MSTDPAKRSVETGDGSKAAGLKQVSLARVREFGVVPKRDLGQNFLIDDNILGVILAQLECRPEDVVLEVGAGLGVLTAALAGVARHVHAFEVDRSLEGPLKATLQGDPKVTIHFQDVLKAKLEDMDPPPTLCASNLPYSVAGPFIIESLKQLARVRRHVVMVQREVAERMIGDPRHEGLWGALGLGAAVCEGGAVRPLARSIFYPQPHVDSSLVVLERLPETDVLRADPARLRVVIQAAFGQRRKTLVNCLSARVGGVPRGALQVVAELGSARGRTGGAAGAKAIRAAGASG